MRMLKSMRSSAEADAEGSEGGGRSRGVIRAVCTVLDSFHFLAEGGKLAGTVTVPSEGGKENREEAEPDGAEEEGGEDEPEGENEGGEDDGPLEAAEQRQASQIAQFLRSRCLPELRRQLVGKGDHVRPQVALALVRALKLLPPEAEELELPRVLQEVANVQRSRGQRQRDRGREVTLHPGDSCKNPSEGARAIAILISCLHLHRSFPPWPFSSVHPGST
jgi:hypothetical protein